MKRITYIQNLSNWKKGFNFSIDINIRFSETDMFGHVNNVSPFIYFEEARIEFLKHVGLFPDKQLGNTIPIVADLQCNYIEQIFFGETIKLYVKTNFVGNSSIDIHYLGVKENGNICLTGRGNMVNIDASSGKSVPLTGEQKEKLLQG